MAKTSDLWELAQPELDDAPADIEDVFDNFVGSLEGSTNRMAVTNQGTLANRPSVGKRGQFYVVQGDGTAANNGIVWYDTGDAWLPVSAPKTIREAKTFQFLPIVGSDRAVTVVELAGSQSAKLVQARHYVLNAANTTWKVRRNGSDLSGWNGTASTSPATLSPTAVSLSAGDRLEVEVGSPNDADGTLVVALAIEHTIV